jgi:uncharacterized protein
MVSKYLGAISPWQKSNDRIERSNQTIKGVYMMSSWHSLSIGLGLVIAGGAIGHGITNLKRYDQSVSVRGLDERILKATESSWNLSFGVSGNSFSEVQSKVNTNQKAIENFLLAKGFSAENIEKGFIQVTDNASYGWKKEQGMRYQASASVTLSTEKVDQVEKAKDQTKELFDQGILLRDSRVKYYFTDLNSVKPEMLKNAAASAREAAEAFARDAGVSVGKIRSATQGLFSISAPNAEYDAESTLMKRVRVVTQVNYFLD